MRRSIKRTELDERLLALMWAELLSPSLPKGPRPLFQDRGGEGVPASLLPRRVLCWYCREYHAPAEVTACMALPRKMASTDGSATSSSNALAPGPLAEYSEIWAFLTATKYPDGSRRKTGRLSLSCESGVMKLSCTDEETGQYVCLSFADLGEALLAFEAGLAAGDLPWRPSKYGKPSRR